MMNFYDTLESLSLNKIKISQIMDSNNKIIDKWIKTNPNTKFSAFLLFDNNDWRFNN